MKIGDRVQQVPETFGETEEIRDRHRRKKRASAPTAGRWYTSIRWDDTM